MKQIKGLAALMARNRTGGPPQGDKKTGTIAPNEQRSSSLPHKEQQSLQSKQDKQLPVTQKNKAVKRIKPTDKLLLTGFCFGCSMVSGDNLFRVGERLWCKRVLGNEGNVDFVRIFPAAQVQQCPKYRDRIKTVNAWRSLQDVRE